MSSSTPLLLFASKSYDPDNPTKQVACQWSCPVEVINAQVCSTLGCDL